MWLLLGLLALLPGMAYMQYRWIGQVSDAARERAKTRLENSVEQLVTEFDAEVTRAHLAFWLMPGSDPEQDAFERFATRYREWTRLAPYPQLIHDAYLIDVTGDQWKVTRIDALGTVKPLAGWPAELDTARSKIEEAGEGGPAFRRRSADFSVGGNPAFLVPLRAPRTEESSGREQRQERWDSGRRRGEQSRETGERRRGPWERMPRSRTVGWAVVSFDAEYMGREFLPELTRRAFQQGQHSEESDYELRVESVVNPEKAIFLSSPAAGRNEFSTPDASAGLFAMRPDCFVPSGAGSQGGPGGMASLFYERAPAERASTDRSTSDRGITDRTKNILTRKPSACGSVARALGTDGGRWKLLVKHRAGSLDSAFATFRLRTLIISFGVLLVLGLGVTMLTVSTERARALARLQMEFAMGISHELRTPLTVIRVAADNLANGMMANAQHAKKYGQVIGDEARRLTEMVEQILTFARTQSSAHAGEAAPVAPEQIVRRALAARSQALRDAGMEVERFIEPELAPVLVDENAIVRLRTEFDRQRREVRGSRRLDSCAS